MQPVQNNQRIILNDSNKLNQPRNNMNFKTNDKRNKNRSGFSTGLDELKNQSLNNNSWQNKGYNIHQNNRFQRQPNNYNRNYVNQQNSSNYIKNTSNPYKRQQTTNHSTLAKMQKSLFPTTNTNKIDTRDENRPGSRRKPFKVPKKRDADNHTPSSKFKRRNHRHQQHDDLKNGGYYF